MHFIFPKNYNFKSKIFGFIDYTTAIFDICIAVLLYFSVNFLFNNLTVKIYVFISVFLPVFLFSVLGVNRENIVSVFVYIFKFFKNQRVYLYKKETYT